MDETNVQDQQEKQLDFINDLYKQLQKDLTKDKGEFVTNFAKKRDFPSPFSSISSDNQLLIKDFYKRTYETSLQMYLDARGSTAGFNVMSVVNTYNQILEFIFGNDTHYGAYSAVSDMYKKNKQPLTDSVELILSCESLYNLNYKIKNTEDGYYLFDPSLNPIAKVSEAVQAPSESYNYLDSLQRFLKQNVHNKNVVTSFEIPADAEKANFPVPENHKELLVTLPDLIKEDSYNLELTKSNDLHFASYFNGNTFSFSNVSFIGNTQRNYHYLGWSYANQRIVKDLSDKYGFSFITTPPTKFLADHDGYLVSKISYVNNEIAQTTFACTPENMSNIMMWKNQLSIQGQVTITKELATYLLVQFGFGYNHIDTGFFFLDEDTREIVHFVENEPDFLKRHAYPSAPNNMVNLQVNDAAQFVLDTRSIKLIAENIVKTNNFSDTTKYPLFGIDEFHLVPDTIMKNLDKISMGFLPKQLFQYEYGVFTSAGKEILNGKNILYNDWFSEHIKKSGMSMNSSLTVQTMNRLSLFSAIAYLINI